MRQPRSLPEILRADFSQGADFIAQISSTTTQLNCLRHRIYRAFNMLLTLTLSRRLEISGKY